MRRGGHPIRPFKLVVAITAVALASAAGGPARAQAPQAPTGQGDAGALAIAKERFREGVALIGTGDFEAALDRFLRSRAAFPSSKNTLNAALCMDRLGRFDQALEMYEEVASRFAAELRPEDKAALGPAMETLRAKVANVEVGANVDGSVVIDGRPRGKLPMSRPIRVLPGTHRIRVLKDGYATAEKVIDVSLGATASVDLTLKPLESAGQLRVEDRDNVGAEVFIDRVAVGVSPWEGTLGPGRHVVWTRAQDKGSAPVQAVVVQGQTAVVQLRSGALGPTTRIAVIPPTAELSLDGVTLGAGTWEGRLPLGSHSAVAVEDGYHPQTVTFTVDESEPQAPSIRLKVDADHPRWPQPVGNFWVGAWSGGAFGTGLGGSAESSCPSPCTGGTDVLGAAIALRAGYRFRFGLSLELEGGYMALQSSFGRTRTETSTSTLDPNQQLTVRYDLHDAIRIAGPFAVAGVSQQLTVVDPFAIAGRISLGALFPRASDSIRAVASAEGDSRSAQLLNSGESVGGVALLVIPEVSGFLTFDSVQVGGGLALGILPLDGPQLPHGHLSVPGRCDPAAPSAACAQNSSALAGERAYGSFLLWMPRVSSSIAF